MTNSLPADLIRAIIAAASAVTGTNLYEDETPGMRATLRFHDLVAWCLTDLRPADQVFRIVTDYETATVEIQATSAALTVIEAHYPAATWYAIMRQFEDEANNAG